MVGIIGFGSYIPAARIYAQDIAKTNPHTPPPGIISKSAPASDEDSATMSVEAAEQALQKAHINAQTIQSIIVGSESHPYAVKPTATIVGQALGSGPWYFAVDTQFACKAGSAALQYTMALVQAGMINYGLAIGADTAQSQPGDILEYTAGAGAAAFVLGANRKNMIATIDATISYTTNTPDFWRRPKQAYPQHTNRFTGAPAYLKHTVTCGQKLLAITKSKPADYQFAVFHQPNFKFPHQAAKKLGFTPEQLAAGLLVQTIGNCYAASSLLGLCAVLQIANKGDTIFFVSYGSGAGSDGFVFTKR